MRTLRFAAVALLASVASLLLCCSFLFETPEYSIELAVERSAYKSVDAQTVRVTYQVTTSEAEDFRARYELSFVDGSLLESGIVSDIVLGSPQTRVLDLAGYQGFGEGRYAFRLVGQTRMGDGTYRDLAFLDRTVEFWVDDTPPAAPVMTRGSGRYGGDELSVAIDLDDWSHPDPNASAVRVYYTLDGGEPTNSSTEYGEPVTISPSSVPVTLRAVAVDAAGWSSSISQESYSFMKCLLVRPSSVEHPAQEFVEVFGYGFAAVPSMMVELWDADGDTSVYAAAVGVLPYDPGEYPYVTGATQRMSVSVATYTILGGSDPSVAIGPGSLVVTNTAEVTRPVDTVTLSITDDEP